MYARDIVHKINAYIVYYIFKFPITSVRRGFLHLILASCIKSARTGLRFVSKGKQSSKVNTS